MIAVKPDNRLDRSPFYGAALIILIAILTNLSNSLTHSLPKNFSSSQILFFKSGIGFCLVLLWYKSNFTQLLKTSYLRWHFLKGLAGALGNWLWIVAVQMLPLADSSALSLTSALITTVGACYFFSENPARPIWLSLAAGFVGVFLILKPSIAIFQFYSFYPLLSALAFSLSSLIIKKVSLKDSSRTTLCYLLLFMAIFSSVPAFYSWQSIEWAIFLKLIGIAILYAFSQLALIEAYTYTQAAFLAPFKFSRFPIAIISGWLFFDEQFSWSTIGGGGIIIASYFYLAASHNRKKDE